MSRMTSEVCLPFPRSHTLRYFALAAGLSLFPLFALQPLLAEAGDFLSLPTEMAGLLGALPLLGYAIGLGVLLPLANSQPLARLFPWLTVLMALAFPLLAFLTHPALLLSATFILGTLLPIPGVLVPLMSVPARFDTVGAVLRSALIGAAASFFASRLIGGAMTLMLPWHAIFFLSGAALVGCAILAFRMAPSPQVGMTHYGEDWLDMMPLLFRSKTLGHAVFKGNVAFLSLCVFWGALPFHLQDAWNMDADMAGWFGAAGLLVFAAFPLAEKLSLRKSAAFTVKLHIYLLLASWVVLAGGYFLPILFPLGALMLIFSFFSCEKGCRLILAAEGREHANRLLVIDQVFLYAFGAAGLALGPWSYHLAGWLGVCLTGLMCQAFAETVQMTESDHWDVDKW